ncbi:hypothetical protein BLOT_016837 [Blomia tropicalis]|nr:hypothetical protein BLOT_016837 [Blomia tropicalis]
MADCQISPMTDKCGPSQTSSKDLSTIPEGRVGQDILLNYRNIIKLCCEGNGNSCRKRVEQMKLLAKIDEKNER